MGKVVKFDPIMRQFDRLLDLVDTWPKERQEEFYRLAFEYIRQIQAKNAQTRKSGNMTIIYYSPKE